MKKLDIQGVRFGRLVATEYLGARRWRCVCDCGAETSVVGYQLKAGRSQSCGCLRAELMRTTKRKHGMSNTPEWRTYQAMMARCTDSKCERYPNYGGRGIKVCDRWAQSFSDFYSDMGDRPAGYSIERINNDGHYEPANCVWASQAVQARNTTRTIRITFNGKEQCLTDWARETGIAYGTMYERFSKGLPLDKVMELAA